MSVDEDEAIQIESRLAREPVLTTLRDVGLALLAGMR